MCVGVTFFLIIPPEGFIPLSSRWLLEQDVKVGGSLLRWRRRLEQVTEVAGARRVGRVSAPGPHTR